MFAYILCYIAGVATLILGVVVGICVMMYARGQMRVKRPRDQRENYPREGRWAT